MGVALVGAPGLLTGIVYAQPGRTMLAEPPAPLLPQALRTGSGHEAGSGAPPESGTAGPVLVEDGIRRYERGAAAGGTVTVYQFDDATGADAAYDYLRQNEMGQNGVAQNGVAQNGRARVALDGVSVVTMSSDVAPKAVAGLLKEIETGLPKVGGPRGLPPLLPRHLPAQELEKGSVRYAVGPAGYQGMGGALPVGILGFEKAAEVVTAKYRDQGTLTLLLYPTPQIAGEHGRQLEAEMNREGTAAGTVKLRREGPLVLLTTGAWNPVAAQKMVDGIHLHNEVTWNKPVPPEFHAEIKKTVSLLTSIAVFCGLGALAAVVLGLFFGGGRAAIRVLQGKPAASEPEFLRIDLSGRSSRIRSDEVGSEPGK